MPPVGAAVILVVGVIASAAVLYPAFLGEGPLPPLGPVFNPATGAWTMELDATIKNEALGLAGLEKPVKVTLEPAGTSHIVAQTDHALFLAPGDVPARFRLLQMRALRRQRRG